MPQGLIVKGVGGFYYVKTGDRVVECRARGKFRSEKVTPLVGDIVDIMEHSGSGVIDKIVPRKTELIRPPVANVDQAIIVFAATKPEPNFELLDKFLLLAEKNELEIIICVNKIDLMDIPSIDNMFSFFRDSGFDVIYTCTKTGYGIPELRKKLMNRITVFAGPSGVGKSSLLNSIQPSFSVKTGEISKKIERGKQTTRHTELLELDGGGYVVDTPGFSSLEIDFINKENISYFFPEFKEYMGLCRFSGCAHVSEPGCAIKNAVQKSLINSKRYESYLRIYNEIIEKQGRNYK